jgi:hypothetical protein
MEALWALIIVFGSTGIWLIILQLINNYLAKKEK